MKSMILTFISTNVNTLFQTLVTDVPKEDILFERHLAIQCSLASLEPFSELILPNVIDLIVLSHNEHQVMVALTHLR